MAASSSHFVTSTISSVRMPRLIYGTAWKKGATAELVITAIRAGFRGVDTACQPKHYTEAGVGTALRTILAEGTISREDLFIQTKFTSLDGQDPASTPYDPTAPLATQVVQSLERSLSNLGTPYVDSLVLHSPMRTVKDTLTVWKIFEGFVASGKVKQLGISNCYSIETFKTLFDSVSIKPAVLQNRLYPESGYDRELRKFCAEKGIFYQSFWTLTANPTILRDRAVVAIGRKYGKTVEQMFFAYLVQTGVVTPLTGTKNATHMAQDLEVLDMSRLDKEDADVFENFINGASSSS
ncbi:uncharacterized oxidoreductase YtbE [Folsomia candida]|uniref:Prostaglandin F synthase n=1 Tax=Folsomia candida TaxID=158441 RepID=A0A226E5Z7_FOLCA|nr:uncharacterized oxidoreductase YtbE [Folsomia candida]OXA52377.1 Prostaglandin F synthase [Folsomia candida]